MVDGLVWYWPQDRSCSHPRLEAINRQSHISTQTPPPLPLPRVTYHATGFNFSSNNKPYWLDIEVVNEVD